MQVLLELGADPRSIADDGAYPEQVSTYIAVHAVATTSLSVLFDQVAAKEAVEEIFKSWDIAITENLMEGLESTQEKRLEREGQFKQAAEKE